MRTTTLRSLAAGCLAAGLLATPALAEDNSKITPDSTYYPMTMYLNGMDVHANKPTAEQDAKLDRALEQKRDAEMAAWSDDFSRDVRPGLDVGDPHPDQPNQPKK